MSEYKGLSIVFEGDATSLSTALSTISSRASAAQGNLTGINKALKFEPTNAALLERKIANLSTAMQSASDRSTNLAKATSTLEARQRDLTQKVKETSDGYNSAKESVKVYDSQISQNSKRLEANETALEKVRAKIAEAKASRDANSSSIKKESESLAQSVSKYGSASEKASALKTGLSELASGYRQNVSESNKLIASLEKQETELLSERSALESNQRSLQSNRAEVGQLVSKHDQYKRELEKVNAKLERNKTDVETSATEMRQLRTQIMETNAALSTQTSAMGKFSSMMRGGAGALSTLAGKLTSLGGKMSVIQGIVVGTFGKSVLDETVNFGNAVSQVAGYLGVSAAKMEQLRSLALETGYETQYSATEAADAMSSLAKGGLSEAEIEAGALNSTIKLAAAGQMDLSSAADITIQTMKSFGLTANDSTEIADALAGAANASTAEVSDLSSAFSNCSAVCSAAGWTVQETAGAIGLLTDRGLSGEQAGTALKVMMQRLQSPTDKAKKVMEKYGIEVRDASGNMKSATDIVQELTDKLGSLDSKSRDNALQTLFGTRSSNAALIFMQNGTEELEKYIDAASESGAATKMAKAQMGQLGWAMEYLSGEFETAKANLGSALTPALVKVTEAAESALSAFNQLSPAAQAVIGKGALMAAAAGPVLLAGGKVVSLLGTLGGSIGTALKFVSAFGSTAGYGATLTNRLAVAMSSASSTGLTTAGAMAKLSGAMSALPVAAVAAGVIALGAGFAYVFAQAQVVDETFQRVEDASDSLDAAIASVHDTTAKTTSVASDAATALDTMATSWETYAETLSDNESSYRTEVQSLRDASDVIEEYAGKTGLSVGQQQELKSAIDTVNQSCGTSYEVFDAANGKIREQGSDSETTAAQLQQLIDQQLALARAEQAAKDLSAAESNYSTQVESYTEAKNKQTKAVKEYNDTIAKMKSLQEQGVSTSSKEYHDLSDTLPQLKADIKAANEAVDTARGSMSDAGEEVDKANKKLENVETTIEDATDSAKKAKKSLQDLIDEDELIGENGAAGWSEKLRESFAKDFKAIIGDTDEFKTLNREQLTAIIADYDGTTESLVTALYNCEGSFHNILSTWAENNNVDSQKVVAAVTEGIESGIVDLDSSSDAWNAYLNAYFGDGKEIIEKAAEDLKIDGAKAWKYFLQGIEDGKTFGSSDDFEKYIKEQEGDTSQAAYNAGQSAGTQWQAGFSAGVSGSGGADTSGLTENMDESGHTWYTTGIVDGSKYGDGTNVGISSQSGNVKKSAASLRDSAKSGASDSSGLFSGIGKGFGSGMASGLSSMNQVAAIAGSIIAGKMSGAMSALQYSSNAWGVHLGNNMASGLRSTVSTISSAAESVANAIAKKLKHSVPKEGPLHDDDVWGMHLAQNLADGMRRGRSLVADASLDLAEAVNEPAMDWGNGIVNGYSTTSVNREVNFNMSLNGVRVNDDAAIRSGFIDLMYELYRREGNYCG